MANTTRSCVLHHAWRYTALALFIIALITALVPLSFASYPAQSVSFEIGILCSGWFFLGLFWNIFVIAWEASRKELMHPGAVVGMDLITWLYGVFAILWGSFSIVSLTILHRRRNFYDYGYEDYDEYFELSDSDFSGATACMGIFVTCAVITTIIHFTLFVAGCINEDKRRKGVNNASGSLENGVYSAVPRDMVAAAVAKQAEIELQEREFGNARQ